MLSEINRLQKVPALEIQDQIICDSHVISKYLCEQSRDKVLYPSTTSIRTRIDEMLFFNSGTLFPIDSEIFTDYFAGKWPVNRDKLNILYSALDHLEFNLNNKVWLTGDEMNLSDICLMSTVTSIFQIVPMLNKHKNINEWLLKCETKPFYEINKRGLQRLVKFMNKFKH